MTYTVTDTMFVKNNQILTLDKNRDISDYNTKFIECDGIEYPYSLTYHEDVIIIGTDDIDLNGKEISFCN